MTKSVGEQRRHPRENIAARVDLGWLDADGTPRSVQAKCVDISPDGIRVELTDPLAVRTAVYVRASALNLDHPTRVRFCRRKGLKFLIGLEFTSVAQNSEKPAG